MTKIATAFAALILGSGAALAQATTPAPVNAPLMPKPAAAAPAAPAAAPMADKKAKSKECSTEADQKGLHGKERKMFRSKCKAGKA